MRIDLSGQTALVTGAGSGIGRATALALAGAGAQVAVNYPVECPGAVPERQSAHAAQAETVVAEIVAAGGQARAFAADVGVGAQVEAMVSDVTAHFGAIDILVNNAGIILEKPFLDMDEADWDRVMTTDLKSVFLCCRAVLPAMVEGAAGCVINIASELGYLGRAGYSAYTSAKGGVITLTRSLAREFAPAIRINAIAPGPVATAMLDPALMSPEVIAQETDIPMQRLGRPEEIAATAVFLASEHAGFYCGQVLSPNGGALMA